MPAPLAPITPTMPAGGSVKERSSISSRSPKPLRSAVGLDDLVAEPLAGRDVDLDLVELDVAVLGQQALVVVQARLGLLAAALGVLAHPLELLLDRALARGVLALLLREARLLLLEPARVVALERQAVAAVELEDPARDVVEEVAIVGDGHDGALVLLEVALEPGDRLGVEVVGRLVEQQQVGRAQQQPAERDAAALAAGELGDVGVGGREPQRVHRRVELGVEVPGVGGVDPLLQARELVGGLVGVVGGELVEAVEQRARSRRRPPRRCRARPWTRRAAGSCSSRPTVAPGASCASPRYSVSCPAMIRSRVDLPEPLRPSTPILAPGMKLSEMSLSTCLSGGCVRLSLYMVKTYWLDIDP